LKYMNSQLFNPQIEVEINKVKGLMSENM